MPSANFGHHSRGRAKKEQTRSKLCRILGGRLQAAFDHMSSVKWMQDFARGIFDTRAVVFHLGGTAFFLFAAARMLESRRWK